MKIFKSKKDTKLVFFFDYLTGKNSYKIYSNNDKLMISDLSADMVLSIIGNDYYEFGVALKEFDLEQISAVVLMPSEYNKKSDKTKLKYIDDIRLDLYSHLIEYDKDSVIFVPFGKYSLYALTKTKDIIRQAGKERNTVIDLSTLVEGELLEGVKKKDLIFKYRTIPNYNPSYLFYNKAVINNFYFIFNYIRKIINNEKIEEKETKVFTSEEEAINFLNDLLSKKDKIKHIYFDIETESVNLSEVLGVSIDYDDNDIPVYIPIFSNTIKNKISEVLKTFEIVGHNLKFDIQQLIYNGFIKNGEYKIKDDTYILGHLIYNKTLGGLSLKHLAKTLIGVNEDWDNAIKDYMRKHNLKSFKDLPENVLGIYASLDAYYTKKLYHRLIKEYKKEYDYLNNQYKEIIDLVMNWELKGVKINREKLEKIENILLPKMKEAVETIKSLNSVKLYEQEKKRELNINSNQQLTELIDNYLYLSEAKKRTKTGLIKLGREELEKLESIYKNLYELSSNNEKIKEKYLFVKSLLEYKLYEKFIKSYINPIKQKIDDFGIFRVDYNIGGTISGRLSSMFHTIPSRGELGKNFKMLVESRNKDYVIVSADFCLTPDTFVYTNSGWKKLIEVKPNKDKVLNDKGEWLDVYCIVDRGKGEVYEIETEKGFKIKSTLNHKYICIDDKGNYRLATLREIIDNNYYLSIKTMNNDNFERNWLYVLLGIFLGDGTIQNKNKFIIYHSWKSKVNFTKSILEKLEFNYKIQRDQRGKNCYEIHFKSEKFFNFLEKLFLIEKKNKRYKKVIFSNKLYELDYDKRLSIILGFINTDVYYDSKYNRFQISNISYDLLQFFHLSLLNVGIVGYFYPIKGKVFIEKKQKQAYVISISEYSFERFLKVFPEIIEIFNPVKVSNFRDVTWGLPNQKLNISTTKGKFRVLKNTFTREDIISKYKIIKIVEKDEKLYEFLKSKVKIDLIYEHGLFFDRIKNVNYVGKQKVYDLSVSGNHLFIANGFVVHNSQLEPRIMASLSSDKHLIEAYNTGKDLYKYMASKVFSIPYDEVPKDKRNQMKTLVLAILYGMSANSLAKKLDISKSEAEEIMINFFNEFPDIARWRDEQFIKVKQQRKVVTPLKREIPVVNEFDEDIRKISVNYQIQSTASEVALIIFKDIEHILRKNKMKSFTIGSVHDSILLEVYIPELLIVFNLLRNISLFIERNNFSFIKVPLKLDLNCGVSWGNSLEIIYMEGNNITLSGKNIDFFLLKNKLEDFFFVKSSIKSVEDTDVSDLSLYKEYDKILKDIVVDLYLEKNNIN